MPPEIGNETAHLRAHEGLYCFSDVLPGASKDRLRAR